MSWKRNFTFIYRGIFSEKFKYYFVWFYGGDEYKSKGTAILVQALWFPVS